MTQETELSCNNSECRVGIVETATCVEGLSLDQCPHYLSGALIEIGTQGQATALSDNETIEELDLKLPKAERLTLAEASALLKAAPSRLVAIVGPTSSGKTSLIASLCNLFQKGKVDAMCFARSRTFFAFEQACHHARAASKRATPETEHTNLGSGVGFYHLGIVVDGGFLQLLLSDRNGEDYRSVADDPTNAAEFVEVKRADSITVLVNGELLLDSTTRHDVRPDTLMILQGLRDGDALAPTQRLAVVLTKLDVINHAKAAERDRALRDFDDLVNVIKARFGQTFQEILPFKIAASPATDILPYAFGSDELLKSWTELPTLPSMGLIETLVSARAMGRFGVTDLRGDA